MALLSILAFSSPLFGDANVSHDQRYFTNDTDSVQLIYTEKTLPFAQHAASLQEYLHGRYQKQFGFALDEKLYVGLMSDYNQIANGFSSPLPNNRQINYMGGTELVDYFSVRSWLDTLIYHETAHNYQMNAKDNPISSSLHKVFGNGMVILPYTVMPNIAINSFLLEGNAVLNESWHGNGGRLYSGRFKAQTLLQVKAGYFTPERMHNHTLFFPYGEHHYTMGGFFQYYLAEKYGMVKVNRFFKQNSLDWYWPFNTNNAMGRTLGLDFERAMKGYVKSAEKDAREVIEAKGNVLVRSKYFSSLNSDGEEVFFLVNQTGVRAPELARYNVISKQLALRRDSYLDGKVVKLGGNYFTQGSAFTNPFRIYQGLFDANGVILSGSESKMIQGFLRDGTPVYFDVPASFDHPRLFVGKAFYADVHSSVYIDRQDSLYYFVQEGKTRTLFKNKVALTSFQGFYGIVSDVDSRGSVYFVANSRLGSSLYRWNSDRSVERVSPADNVVEARLVSDEEVLLAATGADDYYYCLHALDPIKQTPYETTLFFEKDPSYNSIPRESNKNGVIPLDLKSPYRSLLDMHYSGTNLFLGSDPEAGWLYDLQINFADPLVQNAFSGLASRTDDEATVVGMGYRNTQTFFQFNLVGFAVTEKNEKVSADSYRNTGMAGQAFLPWLKKGYWSGHVVGSYQQDYLSHEREPAGLTLAVSESEKFGHSLYQNGSFYADGFKLYDRGDSGGGATLQGQKDLPNEWYVSLGGKGSFMDRTESNPEERRGIKLESKPHPFDFDPGIILMGSLRDTRYVKSAVKGSASVKKVLNFSAYFFTFPLSLRRETVYGTYNHYAIDDFFETRRVNEQTLGVQFETVVLNNYLLPLNAEYIHNDNQHFADKDKVRFYLDLAF